jgi:hypothetical protein
MALKKKGVFFTFVALIFLSLLIFSSSISNEYELREQSFAVETRIDTMNRFLSDVENDIQRAAYISGFRAFVAIYESILMNGEYVSGVNGKFNELFMNGTIDGTNSSFMANNTLNDWMTKIKNESRKIGIIVNFTIKNITLYQDNPWEVKVNVSLNINVEDNMETSQWAKDTIITCAIDLDGLADPVYLIETNGLVENSIVKTNLTPFVSGTNISNLLSHASKGYYTAFSKAPSYLMRLEGNFGSSPYGIESLVDVSNLVSKGITAKDKSVVDYIYFGSANPTKYSVSGAPGWFKLDNSTNTEGNQTHLQLYEVTGLT